MLNSRQNAVIVLNYIRFLIETYIITMILRCKMSKRNWLYGRNVVVTGCSSGMGKAVTELLVNKYGCYVLGIARQKPKLDALKESLNKENPNHFTYRRIDITTKEGWESLVADMEKMNFQPDILINNAGMIQPFGQFSDMEPDKIDRIMHTNLESVIWSCRVMLPVIKKSKFGGIVNVSSASALLPVGGEGMYSATKCAVRGLSETLFQELRGEGIFVTNIMPGPVKTDIYKPREGEVKKVNDSFIENIGISSEVAAKRIVKAIRKRKPRVAIDMVAKLMDLGMRMCPRITMKITASVMRFAAKKGVQSFYPIFAKQIEEKDNIKAMKKSRKDEIFNHKQEIPAKEFFKDDIAD